MSGPKPPPPMPPPWGDGHGWWNEFVTQDHREAERAIADRLARAWGCEAHPYGELSPIDFWFEHQKRLVGFLEVKSFTVPSTRYEHAPLSFRKFVSLSLAAMAADAHAVFACAYADGALFSIPISNASGRVWTIARKPQRAPNDREPVLLVPIRMMKRIPE